MLGTVSIRIPQWLCLRRHHTSAPHCASSRTSWPFAMFTAKSAGPTNLSHSPNATNEDAKSRTLNQGKHDHGSAVAMPPLFPCIRAIIPACASLQDDIAVLSDPSCTVRMALSSVGCKEADCTPPQCCRQTTACPLQVAVHVLGHAAAEVAPPLHSKPGQRS